MNGTTSHPESGLAEQAIQLLKLGPASADQIVSQVMLLPNASQLVAQRLAAALLGSDPRVRQTSDGRWALVTAAQGSPLLRDCAFAVVDVETTGLSAGTGGRVTEIAVVVVEGERSSVVFDSLINPQCPIPEAIVNLTGITSAMVAAAPTFEEVADQLLAVLSGRVFVAHNAAFDWGFVGSEVRRARDLTLGGPRLCTVRLARRLLANQPGYSLGQLAQSLGLTFEARHRAAGDAVVTSQLLRRLLDQASGNGIRTLAQLDALQRTPIQ